MSRATEPKPKTQAPQKANMFQLLKPYSGVIGLLILLSLLSNGINLIIPKIISRGIDAYSGNHLDFRMIATEFALAALFIFIFTYLQSIVQTLASERVARDLREKLSAKISRQSFAYVGEVTPAKLLTNLTSDVDSIKSFVSQAIVSIISSIFLITGSVILLLTIDWKLALAVLVIIPVIAGVFYFVLMKVRPLFRKSREVIDWLNKVISESILGASLIRVLNSQTPEYEKFMAANTEARDLGLSILRLFATLIPVIVFVANMAMLTVLALGGRFVIEGSMTLGDYAAFNSYIALLIFPLIIIGFMSNVIAQANASYQRVYRVLATEDPVETGTLTDKIKGDISLEQVTVTYDGRPALKDVSLQVKAGSRTAIIGPTAAGKTQLFYLLTGLIAPETGSVLFDGKDIGSYQKESFHSQIGFVFQDSIIFNMSLRENIAFNKSVTDEAMEKALRTAALDEFVAGLPEGLDTVISERGNSLSGGQKQRVMLARALAINPTMLLLDDFTARVDSQTEKQILENVAENYPGITLLSITQKIEPIEGYDQIILMMQGEVIASGTHKELMRGCPEYNQIFQSQRSTSNYELQSL